MRGKYICQAIMLPHNDLKNGEEMNHSIYKGFTILVVAFFFIVVIFLTGCESGPYVYVRHYQDKTVIKKVKKEIFITLEISSTSSIDNRLKIYNGSENTIDIMPKKIFLKVTGTNIIVPIEANYQQFIKKRKRFAKSLCKNDNFTYECMERVNKVYEELIYNVYQFGSIVPDGEVEGHFAFDLPDALNETPQKKGFANALKEGKKIRNGVITIGVNTRQGMIEFKFPVVIQIYDTMENIPERRRQY